MTRAITKHLAIDLRIGETGGGHYNAHFTIATIAGNYAFTLNDGTTEQLYRALKELFEPEDGKMSKIIGWYVVNASGEQVAWHKTRAQARKIAVDYSKRHGGVFHTQPEYG